MKYTDFKYCGLACGIYLVKNLINNHVYVGQTKGLFINRWKAHISVANSEHSKNENLLSLAIKKYGIEYFDFSVLETCDSNTLDEREQYWISAFNANSHDNYNQTAGGQNSKLKLNTPETVLKVIELLKNTNSSLKEISNLTNITVDQIYDINSGNRWKQQAIVYPIRNLAEEKNALRIKIVNSIIDDLLNTDISFKNLTKKYNVSLSYIKRINTGKNELVGHNYKFPLRKYIEKNCDYVTELIYDLQNSTISFSDLAIKYKISCGLVYKINFGDRHKINNINYPIRPTTRTK